MKKITTVILSFIALTISNLAFSQVQLDNKGKKEAISFTCIGSWHSEPLFQLALNNGEAEVYYITIKDGDDNILFAERIKGANIKRKYILDIDQEDLMDPNFKLRFEVSGGRKSDVGTFDVSRSIRESNNILIAKR